jgi:hypothetical protein
LNSDLRHLSLTPQVGCFLNITCKIGMAFGNVYVNWSRPDYATLPFKKTLIYIWASRRQQDPLNRNAYFVFCLLFCSFWDRVLLCSLGLNSWSSCLSCRSDGITSVYVPPHPV